MIVLSATNICKSYGMDEILSGISFHVNQGDRVGIVGVNGAGKTTLLNILAKETAPDSGDIFVAAGTTVGYLKQSANFDSNNTVIDEVYSIFSHVSKMEEDMERLSHEIAEKSQEGQDVSQLLKSLDSLQEAYDRINGYGYKSEINGILTSMAFTPDYFQKPISTLSGGEKTRLAMACLLLKKPDILFLDEPTNHLDIGTLKWLEQYLKAYNGTVILISHDRYFLDQTVNKIFQVENHRLQVFNGGYSSYAKERKARRQEEYKRYESQQKEIARQEDMIRRFKQRGTEKLAKRAASREKMLAHVERLSRPDKEADAMKIHFKEDFKSGNDVLMAEGLGKSFGYGENRKHLFSGVDFDIKRGERICIVGANGIGKTTLLKIIMEELKPDEGHLKIGHNVEFGYYDQEQQNLNPANTVLEEMQSFYRLYNDKEMRNILGRFLFRGEQVFLNVGSLSGGEKARLSLLKLMLSGANVLILDEPTNHLDITSKEVFEDALLDYPGTLVVVSHDRYFLNKIPTRIMELSAEGMTPYLGSYDYYMEKKEDIASGKSYLNSLSSGGGAGKSQEASAGHTGGIVPLTLEEVEAMTIEELQQVDLDSLDANTRRRAVKILDTHRRRYEREMKGLEENIARLEKEIKELEKIMCQEDVYSDHVKLGEYHEKMEKAKAELGENYDAWMNMQE